LRLRIPDLVRSIQSQLGDRSSATKLVPLTANLVDSIRTSAPRSLGLILPHPLSFSGEDTISKLSRVRSSLFQRRGNNDYIYLLPTLPAIAWLLNVRCRSDIPYCPVPYAYLALTSKACVVFMDGRKVEEGGEVRKEWAKAGVQIMEYGVNEVGNFVKEALKSFLRGDEKKVVKLWAPAECSWALAKACEPVMLPTCCSAFADLPSRLSWRLSAVLSSPSRQSKTPSSSRASVTRIYGMAGLS
jgi:Xaa-Pro aminopeptidase